LNKTNYNLQHGFQRVLVGEALAFNIMHGKEFIQILFTGRNHWVTISTIGCAAGEVDVFDSLRPLLTDKLREQIASLFTTKEKLIIVRYF
jgi:hypothetical protein